jgi:regulator of nucleoside diphosphate kinase
LENIMLSHNLRPRITLGDIEHHQLLVLAMTGSGHSPDAADDLFRELDRARVVPENKLPADVVRMGSRVTYRTDDGVVRTVELVYPGQANISAERISVLTPVGTALIGLRAGQSITWLTRTGQKKVLTALSVSPPFGPEEPAE